MLVIGSMWCPLPIWASICRIVNSGAAFSIGWVFLTLATAIPALNAMALPMLLVIIKWDVGAMVIV